MYFRVFGVLCQHIVCQANPTVCVNSKHTIKKMKIYDLDITGRGAKIIGDCIKRPSGPEKKDPPKSKIPK